MKKTLLLISTLLIIVILIGCQNDQIAELPECVSSVLTSNGIEDTKITTLGDYSKLHCSYDEPTISDEEVEQYISKILESHAEIIEVTNRAVVESGDVVYVDYVVYSDGNIVKYREGDILKVGTGKYNALFEEALIGATVGIPFSVELPTGEDASFKSLYNITVKSINIYEKCVLDAEFVSENYGLASVELFYDYCYNELKEQAISMLKSKAEDNLFDNLIKTSTFDINQTEIAQYSLMYVRNYENIAELYNKDLTEYVKTQKGMTMDEFYEYCYNVGEREILEYLLVGAIASDLQYKITEEDYRERATQLGDAGDDNMDRSYIEYLVLRDKVLNYFYNND